MAGRKPVVQTQEFHDAVAKAVDDRMLALEARLAELVGTGGTVKEGDSADILGAVLEKLTMNLAAVNQQGERKKPLSPEEVAKRENAFNRMERLLGSARDLPHDQRPAYAVMSKIYFNERFIEPFKKVDKAAVRNEITWTGVPNDALLPINDAAKDIFAAWRESIGGVASPVPTADTRPLYMTAAGLTVRGEPPKRQHVAAEPNFNADLGYVNGDPNAPEVAVLGTIAARARQNSVAGKV